MADLATLLKAMLTAQAGGPQLPVPSGLGDIALPQAAAPAMPMPRPRPQMPAAPQPQGGPMDIVPPGIAGTGTPPAAGGGGLVDKLKSLLGGGASPDGGFNLGNFLTDTGAGMASVDWKDNAFSGFGKGVTAASQSSNEREELARRRALQDATLTDRREDRKFKIEDRTYNRERDKVRDARDDRSFNATEAERADQRKYRQSAEGRAAESHQINQVKSVLEVMKAMSPTTMENLSLDQKLKVDKAISDRMKAEGGDLGFSDKPDEAARIANSVLTDLGLKSSEAPGTPAAPQAPGTTPPPPQIGQIMNGYRYKGGPLNDQNSWEPAQ